MAEPLSTKRHNFLTDLIEEDLRTGKTGGKVVTRFPPEPNGFLHVGHAKSILLNFGVAAQFGGACHLRFDDTNPTTEDTQYVESIAADAAWLGAQWGDKPYFASDYFEKMYACAVRLVEEGKAYVDTQGQDAIREQRGNFDTPGKNSPHRGRSVKENLELLRRMRNGEMKDGEAVLRAKIDMAHPNVLMRDPLLYRIRHAHHHRTGNSWPIYPMYDFAHPLEDAFEGITHSFCTLEFETNRELYDWVLDNLGPWNPRPRQYEFARLALGYTVMSKRKLLQLVNEKRVSGWDDPRMPTIAGMRRRGFTREALQEFCDRIGVAKNNSLVDLGKFEFAIRSDLEGRSPRAYAVVDPLPVTLKNWPAGQVEQLSLPWWPGEPERGGSRAVPFGAELFIEREDFSESPPADWKRLSPGKEVRLLGAFVIKCEEVIKGPEGQVERLVCSVDLASKGGSPADGRKVQGTLHWVHAPSSVALEARLYDRLFTVELPDAEPNFLDVLNPKSLEVVRGARGEPALAQAKPGERFQFMRQGYFIADAVDSKPGKPVFNRTLTLRDTWAAEKPAPVQTPAASVTEKPRGPVKPKAEIHAERRAHVPELAERYARYPGLGVSAEEADVLTSDLALALYFDAARAAPGASPKGVAKWLVNDLLGLVDAEKLAGLPLQAAQFGEFVALVDAGKVTGPAAKTLLSHLVAHGGAPQAALEQLGLQKVEDPQAVAAAVQRALDAHAAEVTRYRAGEKKLFGVLVGAAMRETGGAADAAKVRAVLQEKLG